MPLRMRRQLRGLLLLLLLLQLPGAVRRLLRVPPCC
jgi:hypothetical protein